jgi:hypothetical protein
MPRLVFISHGAHDAWIVQQMARCVSECGADTFLDVNDIATGDEFKELIRSKIADASRSSLSYSPACRPRQRYLCRMPAIRLYQRKVGPMMRSLQPY